MAKKKARKKKAAKKVLRTRPAKRKAARKPVRKPKAVAAASAAASPLTPYLCVKGAAGALDFYRKAFGAQELMRITGTDGSIGHAEIEISGALVFLSDEWPDGGVYSPSTFGGTAVTLHLYVPDVDAFVARAAEARTKVARPIEDMPYGDRAATLIDPYGHRWMVSTKLEDVSKEEMEKRFGGEFTVT